MDREIVMIDTLSTSANVGAERLPSPIRTRKPSFVRIEFIIRRRTLQETY